MKGNGVGTRFLILLFIVGAVLTYLGAVDLIRGNKTPVDFYSLTASDVKKGIIVEGDLYANLGAFMESYTTTNGIKTGSSQYTYLIPVGDEEYMGLLNNNSTMEEQLEAQADATYAYLSGSTSVEPVVVHFKGRVLGLDSESKGYMKSYMMDLGYTENEISTYALSYYIKCENYDAGPVELGIGIVCLAIGAAIVLIPILSARKNQNVMFAHESSSVGTSPLNDDFDSFQSENYDNTGNAQDTAFNDFADFSSDGGDTSQTSDIFNMDSSDNHMNTSGLGAGIADDYKTEQPKSGLGLKLKDD